MPLARLVPFPPETLDIRPMSLEEKPDLVGLLNSPTQISSEVGGDFSGRDSIGQRGNLLEKAATTTTAR